MYSGRFINDKMIGEGILTYKNGDVYSGKFSRF